MDVYSCHLFPYSCRVYCSKQVNDNPFDIQENMWLGSDRGFEPIKYISKY